MKYIAALVLLIPVTNVWVLAQHRAHVNDPSRISQARVSVPSLPAGQKVLFSTLGTSRSNLYNSYQGWALAGPNSTGEFPGVFIAMPFTSKSNAHVTGVGLAISYNGMGANQINLSLYTGANGIPETLIAGPVTVKNLPFYGQCCALTLASFGSVAIIPGTQYWVVADTPLTGVGSDFDGAWNFVPQDPPPGDSFNDNDGLGWFAASNEDDRTAGAIVGTIP